MLASVVDITIRTARKQDATELLEMLRVSEGAEHIRSSAGDIEGQLGQVETEHVLVAEVSRRIVGYAAVQITSSFAYYRPTAELTNIFVLPAARGSHVGAKLLAAVVTLCRERKVLECFARVDRENSVAIGLYEACGFEQASHFEYRFRDY